MDFYNYLIKKETENDYIITSSSVNHMTREVLVDWMSGLINEFGFEDQVLYVSVNFMDRVLSNYSLPISRLQLLASTCIYIAVKVVYDYGNHLISAKELRRSANYVFSVSDLIDYEQSVLTILDYKLHPPTFYDYYSILFSVVENENPLFVEMIKFLCDLCSMNPEFLNVKPSLTVFSVFYLVLKNFPFPFNANMFNLCTHPIQDVMSCAEEIILYLTSLKEKQHIDNFILLKYTNLCKNEPVSLLMERFCVQ